MAQHDDARLADVLAEIVGDTDTNPVAPGSAPAGRQALWAVIMTAYVHGTSTRKARILSVENPARTTLTKALVTADLLLPDDERGTRPPAATRGPLRPVDSGDGRTRL